MITVGKVRVAGAGGSSGGGKPAGATGPARVGAGERGRVPGLGRRWGWLSGGAALGVFALLVLGVAGAGGVAGCAGAGAKGRGGAGGPGMYTSFGDQGADPGDVARIMALVTRAENQFAQEAAERQAMRRVLGQLAGFNGLSLMQRNISYVAADAGMAGARVIPGSITEGKLVSEGSVSVEGIADLATVIQFVKKLSTLQPQVKINAIQLNVGQGSKESVHMRAALVVLLRGELPPAVVLPPRDGGEDGNSMHSAATLEALRARANLVQEFLIKGREETGVLQGGMDVVNGGRIEPTSVLERVERIFGGVTVAGLNKLRINGMDQEFSLSGFARNEHGVEATFARLSVELGELVTKLRVVDVDARRHPEQGLISVFTVLGNVPLNPVPVVPVKVGGSRQNVGNRKVRPGSNLVSDKQPTLPF